MLKIPLFVVAGVCVILGVVLLLLASITLLYHLLLWAITPEVWWKSVIGLTFYGVLAFAIAIGSINIVLEGEDV